MMRRKMDFSASSASSPNVSHPLKSLLWLLLSLALGGMARAAGTDWTGRLAALEATARSALNDTTLLADQYAFTTKINRFNTRVADLQNENAAAKSKLDAETEPLRALEKQIEAGSARIKNRPDGRSSSEVSRYNAAVESYNRLVDKQRTLAGKLNPRMQAERDRLERLQLTHNAERKTLDAEAEALRRRQTAWDTFSRDGGDVRYQNEVNRLLADIRLSPGNGTQYRDSLLARVRTLRRTLAEWAIARSSTQPNGLILVTAQAGDEPMCFIFDTGAQAVTLPQDLVRALGWQNRMGEEESVVGVGGAKTKGRPLLLPGLSSLGQTVRDVSASAIATAEGVGVDGLLGQTFLKNFRITIDPRAKPQVVLQPAR